MVNDVTYIVSSSYTAVSECPDGFKYGGEIDAESTDDTYLVGCSYYTSKEIPEWIYVYCEVWNSKNNVSMAYVRFVFEDIRNSDFIRYNNHIYISLWSDWHAKDASYRAEMKERYEIRIEADIPESGVLVGQACFEKPTASLKHNWVLTMWITTMLKYM